MAFYTGPSIVDIIIGQTAPGGASVISTGTDIKEAMVQATDPANIQLVGHVASRSIRLMMFQTTVNAQWAADRMVKYAAYPLASLTFVATRDSFRLEVGDNFRYSNTRLNIKDMVFRVSRITESNLEKEEFKIVAVEDIEYISTIGTYDNMPVGTSAPIISRSIVVTFLYCSLIEAPYVIAGNAIKIIPLVSRVTGVETGYAVYFSTDGSTYSLLQTVTTFAVRGALAGDYTNSTLEIDDTIGFEVDIPSLPSNIVSITRSALFGPSHLSLIGYGSLYDEIITWQNITPVAGYANRYLIEGVYRNRYGSPRGNHSAGTPFWIIGTNYTLLSHDEFTLGSTRYFKFVPYAGNKTISIADCYAYSIQLSGLSRMPYDPTNFACNAILSFPTYSGLCDLTWSPRIRGDGAGLENPDYVVEPGVDWEGLFTVQVWVGGVKVRTQIGIDAISWSYTAAMNVADNGSLADQIVFKLRNYLEYQGITYSSDFVTLVVNKE